MADCFALSRVVDNTAATEAWLSASSTTAGLFPTKIVTPPGLPDGAMPILSISVSVAVIPNVPIGGGGPQIVVRNAGNTADMAGTWATDAAVAVNSGATLLFASNAQPTPPPGVWWDWTADYLNFSTSAASSNMVFIGPGAGSVDLTGLGAMTLTARVRRPSWTSGYNGSGGTIFRSNAFSFAYEVRTQTTGVFITIPMSATPGGPNLPLNTTSFLVPWASLGWVDDQWHWIQVDTVGTTSNVYTSTDGVSWSLVHTATLPGPYIAADAGGTHIVGNGSNASAWYGSGFGGFISNLTFTTDIAAGDVDLNIGAMTWNLDGEWDATNGYYWQTQGSPQNYAIGTMTGEATATFTFSTTVPLNSFAVFFDEMAGSNGGAYEITEWCLNYPPEPTQPDFDPAFCADLCVVG